MYLLSSKYYLKRRVTNKVVKRFLRLNATLFIDRDIYRYFTIAIYFAPNNPYLCMWYKIPCDPQKGRQSANKAHTDGRQGASGRRYHPRPREPSKYAYNANCLLCALTAHPDDRHRPPPPTRAEKAGKQPRPTRAGEADGRQP